jgi:hypothetical protein
MQVLEMVLRIGGNCVFLQTRLDLFPQGGNPLGNFDPGCAKGASGVEWHA